jgi:hypothetical protein
MTNSNEYMFVGGPANGHKLYTSGEYCFCISIHKMKYGNGRCQEIWNADVFSPSFELPPLDCLVTPERHTYYLENFNGVCFYRHDKDNVNDSMHKLINNYKPKKKKI